MTVAKLEFPDGWGSNQKPFMWGGGVWIFSGIKQSGLECSEKLLRLETLQNIPHTITMYGSFSVYLRVPISNF